MTASLALRHATEGRLNESLFKNQNSAQSFLSMYSEPSNLMCLVCSGLAGGVLFVGGLGEEDC